MQQPMLLRRPRTTTGASTHREAPDQTQRTRRRRGERSRRRASDRRLDFAQYHPPGHATPREPTPGWCISRPANEDDAHAPSRRRHERCVPAPRTGLLAPRLLGLVAPGQPAAARRELRNEPGRALRAAGEVEREPGAQQHGGPGEGAHAGCGRHAEGPDQGSPGVRRGVGQH